MDEHTWRTTSNYFDMLRFLFGDIQALRRVFPESKPLETILQPQLRPNFRKQWLIVAMLQHKLVGSKEATETEEQADSRASKAEVTMEPLTSQSAMSSIISFLGRGRTASSSKSTYLAGGLEELFGNPYRDVDGVKLEICSVCNGSGGFLLNSQMSSEYKDRSYKLCEKCSGYGRIHLFAYHNELTKVMAGEIYKSRDWKSLPILADALEEAGCPQFVRGDLHPILAHLRSDKAIHMRGCWALDMLTGRV